MNKCIDVKTIKLFRMDLNSKIVLIDSIRTNS